MSIREDDSGSEPIAAILVIDDHPLYAGALATALENVFDAEVRSATTLGAGLDMIESGSFAPDLVMLDLRLPDVIGISGFLQLRARLPDLPILVISALAQPEVVAAVMKAGAAGFVPKEASAEVLQQALLAVRAGHLFVPDGYDLAIARHRAEPTAALVAQRIAELTPQQSRIIRLICAGKPNKQIAYEMSLAEATVKAHVTALLRRLGVQNRTQAAVLVEGALLHGASEMSDADARAFLRQ